jgi:hypothetical protein
VDWSIFLKALAILVALTLGIAKLMPKHPTQMLKEALKDDLEILSKLSPDDFGYDIVKNHVKIGITATYTVDRKRWYHVYHWDDLLIGFSIAGIFTYWTIFHIESSNSWGVFTAFIAIVGYAMIPDAFKEEQEE